MKEGGTSLNKTFREYNLVFKGLLTTVTYIISAGYTVTSQMSQYSPPKLSPVCW